MDALRILLYYSVSYAIVVILAKIPSMPYPMSYWLTLPLGLLLGFLFRKYTVQKPFAAFLYGFSSAFLLAFFYTVFTYAQSPIMLERFAKLFNNIPPTFLILLMAILKGLLFALAALTGNYLAQILPHNKPS